VSKRLLVAWFQYSLNGSIGRFVEVARRLRAFGHRVEFLSLTDQTTTEWPDFPGPIRTMAETDGERYDAVMVPGAGNPNDPLGRLSVLRDDRFGLRIQHVLNDPSRFDRFARVNEILRPHRVVFNNGHWTPQHYRTLQAESFHTLAGAVDTSRFAPTPLRSFPHEDGRWIVGAFATKNLAPVFDAIETMEGARLRTFGQIPPELAERANALAAKGRLLPSGNVFGDGLRRFYDSIDVMVTTETSAGWCNTAAEAMASGIPTIVTPAGTIDFAKHGENAIVIPEPSAELVRDAIGRLTSDPALARRLAAAGAVTLRTFDWNAYAAQLLEIATLPRHGAYYRVPELGLHGKWEPSTRFDGLHSLFELAGGATLLDLGAAEGVIGAEFARHGARSVHGFEIAEDRVRVARTLLPEPHVVRQADLSNWDRFATQNADVLSDAYDIVLFLGLYHHLPVGARRRTLESALDKSRRWFAMRTPPTLAHADDVVSICRDRGFRLVSEKTGRENDVVGWLGIFECEESR
jgi:hypothetical protein